MSVENFEHNFNVSKSFHITDAYDGFWGLALRGEFTLYQIHDGCWNMLRF